MKTKNNTYDLIIVGGGIAGLYFAHQYLKKNSKKKPRILILESSARLGGRIQTTSHQKQKYEIGAGRFSNHHILLKKLIGELNLNKKVIRLNEESAFFSQKGQADSKLKFDSLLAQAVKATQKYSDQSLQSQTLFNLLKEIDPELAKKIDLIYPYYSEFHVMNAFDSLKTFKRDFQNKTGYMTLKDGMEQLVAGLKKKIKSKVSIALEEDLQHLEEIESGGWRLMTGSNQTYLTPSVVLALPKSALLELSPLKPITSLLNLVSGQPLYRIYAKFEKQWLKKKIITDSILKYIIPINNDGLTLISYTDGRLTNQLVEHQIGNTLENKIKEELKKIFPLVIVPRIEWIDGSGYWEVGAHYWKPRKVHLNQDKLLQKINHPLNRLYIIGEAYSSYQAWIEGALQTSEMALKEINDATLNPSLDLNLIKPALKPKKSEPKKSEPKNKKGQYTLEMVSKHKTSTDAWMVIRGQVYDISSWTSRHPGGNIILKGLGKDATVMFDNFRHSPRAKGILKDYHIGSIK